MTDENKKIDATAADDAAKAEKDQADADFEASLEGLSDEEKETKRQERDSAGDVDNKIDWKEEAQKERDARISAEEALAKKRFKAAEAKRKAAEEGTDDEPGDEDGDEDFDDEDKPVTKRDLKKILAGSTKEARKGEIASVAAELAESPEEAEYIIELHKNRVFPDHLSIKEQLEECHAIANRKRLQSKNKELARALGSKDKVNKDAASTHRDGAQGTAPRLSASDEASYKRSGYSYDAKDRLWKKKLPNGKTLFKDPKTKQTWFK